MIAAALVTLMVARVVLQMAQPRYTRVIISAARFIELPQPRDRRVPRIGVPRPTRSFLLQMIALGLALWAVLIVQPFENPFETPRTGILVVLDTSGSMTTQQQDGTRMDAARREVEAIIRAAPPQDTRAFVCWRLGALDLELRDVSMDATVDGLRRAAQQLEPRALGTDLALLRGLDERIKTFESSACPITHVVVVSDQPVPGFIAEQEQLTILWRDIAEPVPNVGFKTLGVLCNQLTGIVNRGVLELVAYGPTPPSAQVELTDPFGQLSQVPVQWLEGNTAAIDYEVSQPGLYHFRVTPGQNYALDDQAAVEIRGGAQLRVDWQLQDDALLERLAQGGSWIQDSASPDLRIVSDFAATDNVPTLIVGAGYAARDGAAPIEAFYEPSPLLADLNLDVAEQVGMAPAENLPEGFVPILAGRNGAALLIWIAERAEPPAVYIPGLPMGNDELNRFSNTIFFNALRRLLNTRACAPQYSLTTAADPLPEGTRLALYPDEGNTFIPATSFGEYAELTRPGTRKPADPLWIVLLAGAVLLLALDRAAAALSDRWS